MAEVGILIVDNDVTSQRALKNVLDAEGWQVRIISTASHALPELASGAWNLAIVNIALVDVRGPVFAILRDLAQGEAPDGEEPGESQKRFRVLFLVPMAEAKNAQPILEREGVPYSLKPYHLHDFLEKVSELLVEAGAIEQSLRGIGGFSSQRTRKRSRSAAHARRGTMFASRDDYQMTEEEMAEFERQEEEDRKKREKDLKDRDYRY